MFCFIGNTIRGVIEAKAQLLLPGMPATSAAVKNIISKRQRSNDITELLSGGTGNGPPFPCHQCERMYSHKCNLMRHLRLECGVGPRFACGLCEKKFKHRHHLRDHERTHMHLQLPQHSL